MTIPKMKPCPKCGETDLPIYKYEHGWQHVECDECQYLGPGAGSKISAVKQHNAGYEVAKAAYSTPTPAPIVGGISEDTVRRVLDLLEVYAPGEFTLEMAATVTSAAVKVGGELQHLAGKIAALKLHPATSEEYDAGYIAARNDAFAIIQEAADAR